MKVAINGCMTNVISFLFLNEFNDYKFIKYCIIIIVLYAIMNKIYSEIYKSKIMCRTFC